MAYAEVAHEKFWLKDYRVLFKKQNIDKVWVYDNMTFIEKLNAMSRLIILLTVVGVMTMGSYVIILLGIILLSVVVMIYSYNHKRLLEEMTDMAHSPDDCAGHVDADKHSDENPMYNVLPTDYIDNVNKPALEEPGYSPEKDACVRMHMKNSILKDHADNAEIGKIFNSMEDEMQFNAFMRQFYSNPATSIPNDQEQFLNVCFKDMGPGKSVTVY